MSNNKSTRTPIVKRPKFNARNKPRAPSRKTPSPGKRKVKITLAPVRLMCEGCEQNFADPPSKLCPGCQAYRDHQV